MFKCFIFDVHYYFKKSSRIKETWRYDLPVINVVSNLIYSSQWFYYSCNMDVMGIYLSGGSGRPSL